MVSDSSDEDSSDEDSLDDDSSEEDSSEEDLMLDMIHDARWGPIKWEDWMSDSARLMFRKRRGDSGWVPIFPHHQKFPVFTVGNTK